MMPNCGLAIIDLTESSPPCPESEVLLDAINTAPDGRVRLALRNACDISEEASKIVRSMLLVPTDRVRYNVVENDVDSDGRVDGDESDEESEDGESDEEEEEDEEASDGENNGKEHQGEEDQSRIIDDGTAGGHKNGVSAPNLKRFRPRFATCINCDEEFDVETNDKDSCNWHPGISQSFLTSFPLTCEWPLLTIGRGKRIGR